MARAVCKEASLLAELARWFIYSGLLVRQPIKKDGWLAAKDEGKFGSMGLPQPLRDRLGVNLFLP